MLGILYHHGSWLGNQRYEAERNLGKGWSAEWEQRARLVKMAYVSASLRSTWVLGKQLLAHMAPLSKLENGTPPSGKAQSSTRA